MTETRFDNDIGPLAWKPSHGWNTGLSCDANGRDAKIPEQGFPRVGRRHHDDDDGSGDRWATSGEAPPDAVVQTLKSIEPPHEVKELRPMCRYPNYPRYTGGDAKQAASYTCTPSMP